MEAKHKTYLKLNLMSLFFIAVSFISITLAWFAYSGMSKVATEVGVKAWYIEFQKGDEAVSNNIVISLSDIYPGMDTVNETVSIRNKGDSNAQLSYSIVSARLLGDASDDYTIDDTVTSPYVEDKLSHDYPFHININLSKNYAVSSDGESTFNVSVSWPLDSESDTLDSEWGSKAYQFQQDEATLKSNDATYQVRPSIKVVISVKAEQYIESSTSSDFNYNLGDLLLYDISTNKKCTTISSTCLKTHVIDINNKLGDTTVSLLPDLYDEHASGTYANYDSLLSSVTSSWNATTRPLVASDVLNIVSQDVTKSFLVRENMSNLIIGNLAYDGRMTTELNRAITYNGYYSFLNTNYSYLMTTNCYWINTVYGTDKAFSLVKVNDTNSKIEGISKTSTCSVIPVIIANKADLES